MPGLFLVELDTVLSARHISGIHNDVTEFTLDKSEKVSDSCTKDQRNLSAQSCRNSKIGSSREKSLRNRPMGGAV